MLQLNEPREMWGIGHASTALTGALWGKSLFTFKHQAQAECDEVRAKGVADDLVPILVRQTVVVVEEAEAMRYERLQQDWLAAKAGKESR